MKLPDYEIRSKKGRSILFSKDSPELMSLHENLMRQDHLTVVIWAFDCLQEALQALNHAYPQDPRANLCVEKAMRWARGEIKMPQARPYILDLHAMAKEVQGAKEAALCHAIAQACSSVHTPRHAIGLAMYELTALVRGHEGAVAQRLIGERIQYYEKAMERAALAEKPGPWAIFLQP